MTVSITFQSPYYESDESPPTVHERELYAVPKAKAEAMVDDFIQYQEQQENGSTTSKRQRKMYRYTKDGEELLIALDFDEVIAMVATGEETE